ncbi:hypothetical protein BDZ97DRAFT_1840616 [Flammula alnicola]|nr:hypothetical protein BDZ97DRAFT_1840616 [Flammula alnicola]
MAPLTCRFDPQQMSVWSNRTGVHFFTDAQRDEAYLRARPFLLEQMRILLEGGWRQSHRNRSGEVLINIYKPYTKTRGRPLRPSQRKKVNLILPLTFDSFLDTSKDRAWRTIFENPEYFKAQKQKGNNVDHDFYIGASRALANIFYFLQVLAPGMLVIYHEYQLPDAFVRVSRILPRASWIQRNYVDVDGMLRMEVMGSTDALLTAAKDYTIAFHDERTARPRYNLPRSSATTTTPGLGYRNSGNHYISTFTEEFDGTGDDYTACDKDCAWCGRCPY